MCWQCLPKSGKASVPPDAIVRVLSFAIIELKRMNGGRRKGSRDVFIGFEMAWGLSQPLRDKRTFQSPTWRLHTPHHNFYSIF